MITACPRLGGNAACNEGLCKDEAPTAGTDKRRWREGDGGNEGVCKGKATTAELDARRWRPCDGVPRLGEACERSRASEARRIAATSLGGDRNSGDRNSVSAGGVSDSLRPLLHFATCSFNFPIGMPPGTENCWRRAMGAKRSTGML